MTATLADISNGIKRSNDTLEETLKSQQAMTSSQDRLIALLNDTSDRMKFAGTEGQGDKLEAEREKKEAKQEAGSSRGILGRAKDSAMGGFGLGAMGAGMLAKAGGGLALASALGMKGVRSALIVGLADEAGKIVEDYTGSAEAGGAVERGMIGGGIGLLFGKRIGAISAVIGAALTDENQEKLKELGLALEPAGIALKESLAKLGVKIPTAQEALNGVTSTVGNAIEGLTSLAKGDFSGFAGQLDDLALSFGGLFALMRPMKSLSLLKGAVTGSAKALGTGVAAVTGMNKPLPNAKLPKGTVMSKAGNLMKAGVDGKATAVPASAKQQAQALGAKNASSLAKFPKLMKALRFIRGVPGLGALLGIGEIAMMDPPTVDGVAGVLGGLGGATLGTLAGGLVGAAGGPVALVTAALGGGVGYFLGDALSKGLAQMLMGKKVDAFPEWSGLNGIFNGSQEPESQLPSASTSTPTLSLDEKANAAEASASRVKPTLSLDEKAAAAEASASRVDPSLARRQSSVSPTPRTTALPANDFAGKGSVAIDASTVNNTTNGSSTTVITPPVPSANNHLDPVREFSFP